MTSIEIRLYQTHLAFEQSKDNYTYLIPLKNVMQISQNQPGKDKEFMNKEQLYEFFISCT